MAEKNKYGQYFTISVIADFMVSLISHPKSSKVLEPSCGKGVFLDNLIGQNFENISAYEIDKTLGAKYDFIKFRSFLSVPTTEQYDVVIGNPPYIRWKNLEPELKNELESNSLWNKYFNNLCDYLFIFILKSIEHLTENGELIFICSDYWMNTTHSISLRNYMCENGYIEEIYHFKETPLFEKVTASFVIFKFVKSKTHINTIKLYNYNKKKGLPTKEELTSRSCFSFEQIPQFKKHNRWILANEDIQNNLRLFEKSCKKSEDLFNYEFHRIGDFCDIGNGMVSGLDAAFQIKDCDNLNENEKLALINVLKAKDLKAYKSISITKYIFIQENINKDEFAEKYPHYAEHFSPYMEKLAGRYSYNRDIPYWEFVFPRNQKMFERKEPRIFIPCKERISHKDHFRFCYAPEGFYPTQDVTAIFKNSSCKESIEYLLAYLNNKRVFEWLYFNGIVKGDIVEFSEAPIASIPYRPINWEDPFEIELHNQITQEVKNFLSSSSFEHIKNINNLFNNLFGDLMSRVDFSQLISEMRDKTVERLNKAISGTLSGHAAGEPFEKCVYHNLKEKYPDNIFKQYEYLNDIYLHHPKHITVMQRRALFDSPTALFLLSRGENATKNWSPTNIFEEKQNDTADILFYKDGFYNIIDVKTRNKSKSAMPPNIISAYKLAQMCALMLDNEEYDNINIDYVEIDWIEEKDVLHSVGAHHGDLFKANPSKLYINWAAAMQIQFHVCELDQSWIQSREKWAREYLKVFVKSAEQRCEKMKETYINPFLKYIQD